MDQITKINIMAFNGTEGGLISLSQASEMTADYRNSNPGGLKGHFFGKDILLELLDQPSCKGIRIYYAENSKGRQELVLVGADASENDILEKIADLSTPCPNRCSVNNPLNS